MVNLITIDERWDARQKRMRRGHQAKRTRRSHDDRDLSRLILCLGVFFGMIDTGGGMMTVDSSGSAASLGNWYADIDGVDGRG